MPASLLKKTRPLDGKKYSDEIPTLAIPVAHGDDKCFQWQIRSNCYLRGEIWGHFYIYWNAELVPPHILQLSRHVADVFDNILQVTSARSNRYESYSFLIDLLGGAAVEPHSLDAYYWQLDWQSSEKLAVLCIASLNPDYDKILFDWICDNVSDRCPNAIVFPYEGTVAVITSTSERIYNAHFDVCASMTAHGEAVRLGVSYEFTGLENLRPHFFQSRYAITKTAGIAGAGVHHFRDCAFDGALHALKQSSDWRAFIYPKLFDLIASDLRDGSEYFKTLYYYFKEKNHLASVASSLFVHRNTVRYRLERIERFLELDLSDSAIIIYLHFCCSLLTGELPELGL
jgi:sugar diacid utilization regulator